MARCRDDVVEWAAMTIAAGDIDLGCWPITAAGVAEYLAAVGDTLPAYADAGLAPPLLLTARVVGRLLERLSLPDGAIHSVQEVETLGAVRIGASVRAAAQVAPVRARGGMRLLTVTYVVSDAASGQELQRGQTTVLLPADAE